MLVYDQALLLDWLYNSAMRYHHRIILILCLLVSLGFLVLLTGRAQPVEPITILTPGESSLVTAPIEVSALVFPGEDGLIRVTLVDQQQNLLARQLLRVTAPTDAAIEFTTQLAFEIPGESTPAILTIATQDEAHRPLALRSAGLALQMGGDDRIEPHPIVDPWLKINQPQPGVLITQSPMLVKGTVTPLNNKPIIIELLTERGGAIVSKQLAVESPGEPMAFEVSLIYSPPATVREMRLVIRQPADIIGVDAILDSLPFLLAP